MYAYVDRPVASLNPGSRFLLMSMRRWVMALASKRCAPSAIGAAFGAHDLLPALPSFHELMSILNHHARQNIRFAPGCCPRVSEDEAVLLALAEAACLRPCSVQPTVSLLLKAPAVAEFTRLLFALAKQMQGASLEVASDTPPA